MLDWVVQSLATRGKGIRLHCKHEDGGAQAVGMYRGCLEGAECRVRNKYVVPIGECWYLHHDGEKVVVKWTVIEAGFTARHTTSNSVNGTVKLVYRAVTVQYGTQMAGLCRSEERA